MENCFLCGKPALKRVEIEVGSSRTTIDHQDHHHRADLHRRSHTDRGTTTHYELKPLCADCIKQREEEALETLKTMGKAGELVVHGIAAGLKIVALFLGLGLLLVVAVGGALFYFFGQH